MTPISVTEARVPLSSRGGSMVALPRQRRSVDARSFPGTSVESRHAAPSLSWEPPSQRGFTLLELLIVLAILALGATLVAPSINSGESRVFAAQLRQAESALNYARRMAIVRSSPIVATFRYHDPNMPRSFLDEEEPLPADDQARVPTWESQDIAIRFSTHVDEIPEEREKVEITFFPQGGSTGGILNFELNDMRARIRVDPITGRITSSFEGDEDFE